jgi:hypothetical protein
LKKKKKKKTWHQISHDFQNTPIALQISSILKIKNKKKIYSLLKQQMGKQYNDLCGVVKRV